VKQINRHLIAVAQFLFSVAAGFAFGFIGIELIVGNLDFGFRLLLGIMIALIIALAEIYFLAKTLNEEYDIINVDQPSQKEGVEGSKVVIESISATKEKVHAE
jgi:TMEM199 family protein